MTQATPVLCDCQVTNDACSSSASGFIMCSSFSFYFTEGIFTAHLQKTDLLHLAPQQLGCFRLLAQKFNWDVPHVQVFVVAPLYSLSLAFTAAITESKTTLCLCVVTTNISNCRERAHKVKFQKSLPLLFPQALFCYHYTTQPSA